MPCHPMDGIRGSFSTVYPLENGLDKDWLGYGILWFSSWNCPDNDRWPVFGHLDHLLVGVTPVGVLGLKMVTKDNRVDGTTSRNGPRVFDTRDGRPTEVELDPCSDPS